MRPLPASLLRALTGGGVGLTVLVVRLGAMGDVLRTLPPVRLLREGLPDARIVWAIDDRWEALLKGHTDLDELILLPRTAWDRLLRSPVGWPTLLRSVRAFARRVKAVRAGLALDFHANLRSGLTCRFSSAPVRVGYGGHQGKEGSRWFVTHHVDSGDRRTPRMERNLDLVRALGLRVSPLPNCALALPRSGRAAAAHMAETLLAGRRFAVVSPGASARQSYKKPPLELLVAAIERIAVHERSTIVVYGPGELSGAEELLRRAGGDAVLAPPTDLPLLAALIERADLFIGGDSGPLHLACAVGCPVVGLYGPTDPRVNQPWGVPHRTVFPPQRRYTGIKRIDREAGGFEGLDPARVATAVDEILG